MAIHVFALVSLFSLWSPQNPGEVAQSADRVPRAFETMTDQLWQFELRRPQSTDSTAPAELSLLRMDGVGEDLRAQESRTLWTGPCSHPAIEPRLDFAALERGGWMLAGTSHGGAVRSIPLWIGPNGDPRRGTTTQAVQRALIRRVSLPDVVDPASGNATVLVDLLSPQLFTWRGRVHVVAAGFGHGRPMLSGQERVWIASLPDPDDSEGIAALTGSTLDARVVADGNDPRIVLVGDEVILGIRAPRHYLEEEGEADLHVFRSRDLVTWRKDEALSANSRVRRGYDLLWQNERLWLATPMTGDRASVEVRRFEPGPRRWERAGTRAAGSLALASADSCVWLVDGVAAPAVVSGVADGHWMRRNP